MNWRFALQSSVICLVLLSFAAPAWAQRDLGTIVGTVTDTTGAVVPGATVTIIGEDTGITETLETNASGGFVRPALRPGSYTVRVEKPGFKVAVSTGNDVGAAARLQVNLVLELGDVTETIEVTGAPPALKTETTEMGGTLDNKDTRELPLSGQRKFAFLARLAPAVYESEPGARDAAGGGFSANGVRSNGQNNFLLNGVDNNVNVIDFLNQTAYVIGPSVEAIGEMQIITNGYNAEYGRAAGGVVNVTIKSGTNEIHGVAYEFFQNDELNANAWELNRAGIDRGKLRQNQFGAAVGGPIVKNRTFWFADYEHTEIRSRGVNVLGLTNPGGGLSGAGGLNLTIPWPSFTEGDFSRLLTGEQLGVDAAGNAVMQGAIFDPMSQRMVNDELVRDPFPNNMIPQNRMDPASAQLAGLFPAPNQNLDDRIPANNFAIVVPRNSEVDKFDVRIDHQISPNDTLFGSVSYSEEDKLREPPLPGVLDAGGFGGNTEQNLGRNAMLSYTRVWSPSVITESRVAYSRLVTSRTQALSDVDAFSQVGIGGINPFGDVPDNGGLPRIGPEGFDFFGSSEWLPSLEFSNVWDFIQNVSWQRGNHAIKFGFEFRPIGFPFFQVPSPRGLVQFDRDLSNSPQFTGETGDGFASFLLGYPSFARLSTNNFISSQRESLAWFFQDDWRLSSKLTVNLGVRYEIFRPIAEKFGRQSNLNLFEGDDNLVLEIPEGRNQDAPLPPNFATEFPQIAVERGVVSKRLRDSDLTNVAPRVGIAYEFMDRTVLRAGYGMFYGGEENQGGFPNRGESIPFNQTTSFTQPSNFEFIPQLGRFSDGFPLDTFSQPAAIDFRSVNPRADTPLVHKWNLNIQREIGWNTIFEAGYVGSKGSRLLVNWNPNQPVNAADPAAPVNPRRRFPFLTGGLSSTEMFGKSLYHALTAKAEKRFSDGVDFLASYTWGHALANTGTTLTGFGTGLRDITLGFDNEYATAQFDIRHRFVFSGLFELPFGQGRRYGSNWGGAAEALLGGWQVNTILTLQSGQPFSIGTRNANCGCGGAVRPDLVPGQDPNDDPPGGSTPELFFNTDAVTDPAFGTFGNLGHFSNTGDAMKNFDFSVFKTFPINERFRIQFRSEFFNLFNRPQFNVQAINAQQGSSGFGRINGTNPGAERRIQFALRLQF